MYLLAVENGESRELQQATKAQVVRQKDSSTGTNG